MVSTVVLLGTPVRAVSDGAAMLEWNYGWVDMGIDFLS